MDQQRRDKLLLQMVVGERIGKAMPDILEELEGMRRDCYDRFLADCRTDNQKVDSSRENMIKSEVRVIDELESRLKVLVSRGKSADEELTEAKTGGRY